MNPSYIKVSGTTVDLFEKLVVILQDKGYNAYADYSVTPSRDTAHASIHYSAEEENINGDCRYCYNLDNDQSLADVSRWVNEIPSVKQVKLGRLLEAIRLLKDSAAEFGVEMPENWINPLNEMSDRLRLNILEAPKAE